MSEIEKILQKDSYVCFPFTGHKTHPIFRHKCIGSGQDAAQNTPNKTGHFRSRCHRVQAHGHPVFAIVRLTVGLRAVLRIPCAAASSAPGRTREPLRSPSFPTAPQAKMLALSKAHFDISPVAFKSWAQSSRNSLPGLVSPSSGKKEEKQHTALLLCL